MKTLETIVDHMFSHALTNDVRVMAIEILGQFRFVDSILVYGSVLRGADASETLIDFYVVVHNPQGMSSSKFGRFFGNLLPPNVYFIQKEEQGRVLRCKCTVVTYEAFAHWVAQDTRNPYFWARFSQPSALVYARDTVARLRARQLVSQAIRTAYGYAVGVSPISDPISRWKALYRETYRTELRPESVSRAAEIVDKNISYYAAVADTVADQVPLVNHWPLARLEGKFLSVFRLCKAAFTFQGGADYAVWKIERHTGEKIELQEWQRKHPIVAGLLLLPRLMRKRVIR